MKGFVFIQVVLISGMFVVASSAGLGIDHAHFRVSSDLRSLEI